MAKRKKKRKQPIKRAVTLDQARGQLGRYERLLSNWLNKSDQAPAKVRKYRRKAAYYAERVGTADRRIIEAAEKELGRPLRLITLDVQEPDESLETAEGE